ncbi:MAG: hypothetical protein PUF37_05740 [Prevotellaceae bacterium]|nr:hypothetical protein [Prevotellaceae bacterium]
MVYDFTTVNYDHLRQLINRSGLSEREFSKQLWGDNTHLTVQYFQKRPDIRVSSLIKMAEILHCSIEEFFQKSDSEKTSTTVDGNRNIVNSNNVRIEINNLKAENRALKMLIAEKDKRLEEQKQYAEQLGKRLDLVLQLGQKKDSGV